jgi:dTDP-4-amino-4,6-dideoxygalactose transaminase
MSSLGGKRGDLPISERLAEEVLSLPLYPELPLDTLARIVASVKSFSSKP